MDRMMDDMLSIFNSWPSDMLRPYDEEDFVIRPWGDFYREDGKVVAEFEIPGIDPKEVDLKVFKDRLELKAEKNRENKVEKENFLRSERYYGSVSRSIQLPFEIDPSAVRASYKNGILKIELQEIVEADDSTKVEISIED
jgi:HSP20 family protein